MLGRRARRTCATCRSTTATGCGSTSCGRRCARDREAGVRPIAVVANAGTASTGAVDDLAAIADVCRDEDLWLHVDAAYGGPAMLADDLRPLVRRHRARRLDRVRPAQVAVHPAVGRVRARARHGARCGDRSTSSTSRYIVKDEEHTDWGIDLGRHSPQLQPRLLGAEGLGLAARARPRTPTPGASPTTRRSPATSATLVEERDGLRADDAGRPVDHLLPVRARRACPRRPRAATTYLDRAEPAAS